MTSPSPLLCNTYYHIYNRGTNGENIFVEERNYEYFLKLYEKHISPIADTFAYCMLRTYISVPDKIGGGDSSVIKDPKGFFREPGSSQARRLLTETKVSRENL
jgi:hypothetical protein